MDTIIMATFSTIVGVVLLVICFGVLMIHSGLSGERPSIKSISLIVCFGAGILLFGFGVKGSYTGDPKTSIKAGSYTVVGYAEVSKGEQPYYQMILEQGGEARLYALPKDMIDVAQNGAKGGTLEVVEKSGLRKAILYLPIPGGLNPFP